MTMEYLEKQLMTVIKKVRAWGKHHAFLVRSLNVTHIFVIIRSNPSPIINPNLSDSRWRCARSPSSPRRSSRATASSSTPSPRPASSTRLTCVRLPRLAALTLRCASDRIEPKTRASAHLHIPIQSCMALPPAIPSPHTGDLHRHLLPLPRVPGLPQGGGGALRLQGQALPLRRLRHAGGVLRQVRRRLLDGRYVCRCKRECE